MLGRWPFMLTKMGICAQSYYFGICNKLFVLVRV